MHGAYHTGYLAHGNTEGKARGRSRHKNNNRREVRNVEESNVDTKGNSSKQGLISAKDLDV